MPITVAATAFLTCATSAQAVSITHITATAITAPASPAHLLYDADADPAADANQLHITGTATGAADTDTVDVLCAYHDWAGAWKFPVIAQTVATTSGSFAADVSLEKFALTASDHAGPARPRACKLFAVDSNLASSVTEPPGNAAGALVATSVKGLNQSMAFTNGKRTAFSVWATGFRGGTQLVSPGYGGASYYFFADAPERLRQSESIFYDNPALYNKEIGGNGDRASIKIDGRDAFDPHAAAYVHPSTPTDATPATSAPGFQELKIVGTSFDAATGSWVVDTSAQLIRCPDGVARNAIDATTCPAFTDTGVTLDRRIVVDHDGAMITVQDRFVSTDGASHALDVLFAQDGNEAATNAMRFWFPWLDAGFRTTAQSLGDVISAPPSRVSTTLVQSNNGVGDGDVQYPLGSHTLSSAPGLLRFADDHKWETGYVRTIPAGGAVAIQQSYVQTTTLADLGTLRAAAEDSARKTLTVALDAPAATSVPTVTATGRATGLGTLTALTLNGAAAPVGGDGTWSAQAPLQPGENTLTATVTDSNGDKESATRKVTYTPPPAKLTFRRMTFTKGVFSVNASCPALALKACAGAAKATATVKVMVRKAGKTKTKTRTVTLAAGKITVAQGKSKTVKVKLSRKGKSALANARKLKVRVTLTQVVEGKRLVDHRSLTIRAAKKAARRR